MKVFLNNNNSIHHHHSPLIQSKIKTVSSIDQSRVSYFPQFHQKQLQQSSSEQQVYVNEWIRRLTSTSYLQTNSFSNKYYKFQSSYDYYHVKVQKIDNIIMSSNLSQLFSNSNNKSQKNTNGKPYIQITSSLVCQSKDNQSDIWKSQMILLQFHKRSNKFQSEQQTDMYFYVQKNHQKVLKLCLNILISDQSHASETIIQSRFYGYAFLDFYSAHGEITLQIFQDLQSQNQIIQKMKNSNNFQQKRQIKNSNQSQQFPTIKLKIIQTNQFEILKNVLQPGQIYGTKSQIPGLRYLNLPKDNDSYNMIKLKKIQNLNLQILDLTISQSQVRKAFQAYKQFSNLNARSSKDKEVLFENFQYSVKQYRLFFMCHNGLTICDSSSVQLKQLKQVTKSKSLSQQKQKQKQKPKSQLKIEGKQKQIKDNDRHLCTDQLAKLSHFINDQGIVFIIQLMAKVQFRSENTKNTKNRAKIFTMNIPLGFLIKSTDKLQNDLKYSEKLIEGQALNFKGIQAWLKEKQKKQLKQSALMVNQSSQFISLSKVRQKAESISQSTIQFYVYKESVSNNMPISRIMQKSQYLQKSNISIKPNYIQSDLMYSQSFFPQNQNNDIKKIIMQKSRIIRQTQKLKQIIKKKNIQQNRTIPLLDPSQIKKEIYQQKISRIRQQKQKIRQMHHFLKSKLDQLTQPQKKQDLIADVLINLQNGNKVSKLPKQFINAKSKVSGSGSAFNQKQAADNKAKGQQLGLFYPEPVEISTFLSQQKSHLIISKIQQLLKANNSLQFLIQNIQIKKFQNKKFNICYCSSSSAGQFKVINNKEINLPFKISYYQRSQQNLNKINDMNFFALQFQKFQKITENLLIAILSSYITLYFFDIQTNLILGQSFLNLRNLLLSRLKSNESQVQYLSIYNNVKIIGQVKLKFASFIDRSLQAADIDKKNTLSIQKTKPSQKITTSYLRQVVAPQIENQQYRKLQRIKRFKQNQQKQESHSSHSHHSNQLSKKQQLIKNKKNPIQENIKSTITINYHSLDSFFFQIQVQNLQNFSKTYTISINDQDKQFYDTQGQYDELIIVTNQKYRNQIKTKSNFNWIKPDENSSFSLKQKEKGIILFSYLSDRKSFPFQFIQKIDPQILSSYKYKQQLNIFNRPHNITLIISSQQQIQSIHKVKIQPQHDNNLIFYQHFVDFTKSFQIFLKIKSLQNIYFNNFNNNNQFFDLIQDSHPHHNQQLILKGNNVKLKQFQIVNFMIYEPSYQLFKRIQPIKSRDQNDDKNFNSDQQKLLTNLSKQKFLNNYIILFGAQKLHLQCRLFETIDTMFTLKTDKIFNTISEELNNSNNSKQTKKEFLVLSYDETKVGFRSSKDGTIFLNRKKIFINMASQNYLLKIAATSHQVGFSQTKLVLKDQKGKIVHRLLVETKTQSPIISGTVQILINHQYLQQTDDQIQVKVQINKSLFTTTLKQNQTNNNIQSLKIQTSYPEIISWNGQILNKKQVKKNTTSNSKEEQSKIIIGLKIKIHLLKAICNGNITEAKLKKLLILMGVVQGNSIIYYEMVFKLRQAQMQIQMQMRNRQFALNVLENISAGPSLKKNSQKRLKR